MSLLLLCLLFILCAAAALLEIRCMMRKTIPDNSLSLAGRRIKVAGYLFLSIRFLDLLIGGDSIFAPSAIALCLVAFGDCIRCANRLHLPESIIGTEVKENVS